MVRFGQLALLLTGGFCFATFLLLGNRLTHIASSSLTTTLTLAPDAACPLPTVAAATIAVANCSAAVENGRQALAEVSCPAQSIGSGSSSSSYIPFHPFYDLNRSRLSVFDELAGWYLRPWTPLSGRPAFVSQRMLDVMEVTYRTEAFRFRIVGRQLLYRHTAWWPQTYRLDRMNWWLVLLQQLIDEGRVTDGVDALFSMSDGPRVGSDTMFQTSKGAAAFPLFTMRTSVTHVGHSPGGQCRVRQQRSLRVGRESEAGAVGGEGEQGGLPWQRFVLRHARRQLAHLSASEGRTGGPAAPRPAGHWTDAVEPGRQRHCHGANVPTINRSGD